MKNLITTTKKKEGSKTSSTYVGKINGIDVDKIKSINGIDISKIKSINKVSIEKISTQQGTTSGTKEKENKWEGVVK